MKKYQVDIRIADGKRKWMIIEAGTEMTAILMAVGNNNLKEGRVVGAIATKVE